MTFIGEVKPTYGRWVWPLKDMKEGEYFIVDHTQRAPFDVRNYVSVRASQLNKSFSVMSSDPENPGYTRVTCVPYGQSREARKPVLEYGTARSKIMEWFGLWLDEVPLAQLSRDPVVQVPTKIMDAAAPARLVFLLANETIGMEQHVDALRFYKLPHGWTVTVWEKFYHEWEEKLYPQDTTAEERLLKRFEREAQSSNPELKKAMAQLKLDRLKAQPEEFRKAIELEEMMG